MADLDSKSLREYWRRNTRLIAILLGIWFLVSYVFAIFMGNVLYDVSVGKLPMSFWWAQQGSMFVFVVLIFVYARQMDRLDREFGVSEEDGDER
ncbi:MAG: DUF4212 domain-containing protein [Acidobacteriota bacterium]